MRPLRFEPVFKTMLWGGMRLRPWLGLPPDAEHTGEAWILSDVRGSESRVRGGEFHGQALHEIIATHGPALLGDVPAVHGRFPLLLKFIDARQELSVQVHPNDEQARAKHPQAAGKTEAWVVLDANPATSRIYAGFKDGVTEADFRRALSAGVSSDTLHAFTPERGDCVFLPAGTVHAIGADILLFEVQQTSDITYRLHDWNRVDAKTGQPRDLHIDDGLACSDFRCGPRHPVRDCTDLVDCNYFRLSRMNLTNPVAFEPGRCTIITVIDGRGQLGDDPLTVGDTILIPAAATPSFIVPEPTLDLLVVQPR